MQPQLVADFARAFKEADIRGVYPKEIDEEVVYLIARAFVEVFSHTKVLVGRDMRLSSPQLHAAFVKGVCDAGASVVDLGLVTTPMLYFASGTMQLPGVMITASHSPKQLNGCKLVQSGAVPLTERTGLGRIRRCLEKGIFAPTALRPGKVVQKNIQSEYERFVLAGVRKGRGAKPVRVVVDVGNGMGSLLLPLFAKLNIEVTPLFPELDGNFPHRASNPLIPKNQTHIINALKTGSYDFGIAFDGDADRAAFFDERGVFINSALIGALIAERLLATHPHAKCVYTVLTSRSYKEAILTHGGVPVRARVGHTYIKEVMRKQDVLFGCEHSGHFYYKDFFYTDSAFLTVRHVLACYQSAQVPFSALIAPYLEYYQTADMMVEVSDKKNAMDGVEQYLKDNKPVRLTKYDGITADFGDAWVVVKPSVTEEALNIIAESSDKRRALALRDACVAQVRALA